MHSDQPHSRSSFSRRSFLSGVAGGAVAGGGLMWVAQDRWKRPGQAPISAIGDGLALPGPYEGRVIEIQHPQAAHGYKRNQEAVRAMIDRGMRELVGVERGEEAWRRFFARGDRVGIKVVPVGMPHSVSSPEIVKEVIDALVQKANVRPSDIMIFDRYLPEFRAVGYDKVAEEKGVGWECESVEYDEQQVRIDGQLPDRPRSKRVSGYDPDVYREMAFCAPAHDKKDDRRFRSHLSMIISRKIDKFISIPVLKDHRSAGVTLALKNLSHGSVNNVARSHISNWNVAMQGFEHGMTMNSCGTFIPAMVSMPRIREKAVLQILDGLVATYEGGPGAWNSTFATWNHNSLFFATDPVALDHVGWRIIDKKRAKEGWAPVAKMGIEGEYRSVKAGTLQMPSEQFQMRQPEHISLAATLGLGTFEMHRIEHRYIDVTNPAAPSGNYLQGRTG